MFIKVCDTIQFKQLLTAKIDTNIKLMFSHFK